VCLGYFAKNVAIVCGGKNEKDFSKDCYELDAITNR
jgi:hypothetical protein